MSGVGSLVFFVADELGRHLGRTGEEAVKLCTSNDRENLRLLEQVVVLG
jgi:hypothetical protein